MGRKKTKDSLSLRFLYGTAAGRLLLKGACAPGVSRACGRVLDSRISRPIARRFIRKHHITPEEYYGFPFTSFNDCFTRRIKEDLRPLDSDPDTLISPCDGYLSVYRVRDDLVLPVKHSHYSIASLLNNPELAEHYRNGWCLVFRLAVDNYHRYCYIDNGTKKENIFIPGVLHTVRPVALERYPVFTQNSREYTQMETEHFGLVTQVEVGAMLVGKIKNHQGVGSYTRGEEKGMFLYGGSTVILLLEDSAVSIDEEYLVATSMGMETAVRLGSRIGCSKDRNVHRTASEESL